LRVLSDFRDNVLSRNASGRAAIRLYSRIGIAGSFVVLLVALFAAMGCLTWRHRKHKQLYRHAAGSTTRDGRGPVAQPQGAGTSS